MIPPVERDLLIDCWHQFSISIETDHNCVEWMSDGALSTLEDLADYLVECEYLIKHPSMDLYRVNK